MATLSTHINRFVYGIHAGHAIRLGQPLSGKARDHTTRPGPNQRARDRARYRIDHFWHNRRRR